MFDGNNFTPGQLVCLMVSGRVVCFLLFCFVFTWMVLSRMRMRLLYARNFLEKGLAPDYVVASLQTEGEP